MTSGIRVATVSEIAALARVGLRAGTPVQGRSQMRMPPLYDVTAGAPTGRMGPRTVRANAAVTGRRLAADDLRERAAALGAVGVVGLQFAVRQIVPDGPGPAANGPDVPIEFTAIGTPVSADTAVRPARPFRCTMGGADVAALLLAGWVPVDVILAGTVEVRDDRFRSRDAFAVGSYRNAEIPGYTDLLQRARRRVRELIALDAALLGADGVLAPDRMDVVWSSSWHVVQVTAVATAIARFTCRRATAPRLGMLPYLPLDGPDERRTSRMTSGT